MILFRRNDDDIFIVPVIVWSPTDVRTFPVTAGSVSVFDPATAGGDMVI
jgi:hypothetical protein